MSHTLIDTCPARGLRRDQWIRKVSAVRYRGDTPGIRRTSRITIGYPIHRFRGRERVAGAVDRVTYAAEVGDFGTSVPAAPGHCENGHAV